MDTNLFIAIVTAVSTVLVAFVGLFSYIRSKIIRQQKDQSDIKERIKGVEISSESNRENFKAHEDLYTKQLEVLSEIKADVKVSKAKIFDIEKRMDREFQRNLKNDIRRKE